MVEEVLNVITKWQSNQRLTTLDEAKIKQVVILPIFRGLRWDSDNDQEVCPEYSVAGKRVDYALLIGKTPKVFIEVKKGGEPLENHQEQLLNYSFKEGIKIAVLTNGATWWFYLPLQEGSWEQRKFETIELYKWDKAEIAQKLIDLLGKENVISGKAVENAENLRKKHHISETFPAAWNQLVSEPDSLIIELLAEKTQDLCGHKPDAGQVEQFLSAHSQHIQITSPTVTPPTDRPPEPVAVPDSDSPTESEPTTLERITSSRQLTAAPDLTFWYPTSFKFCGTPYRVQEWSEMKVRLCEVVRQAHRSQFDEEVLRIRGSRGMIWFSRNRQEVYNSSRVISGTSIYVRTHGGGNEIVKRSEKIITHFGHNRNDFGFTAVRKGEDPIKVRM